MIDEENNELESSTEFNSIEPSQEVALGETPDMQQLLDAREQEVITPEVVEDKDFAPPFKSRYGRSSVDLSIPGNNELMLEEYNNWWHLKGNDPQRDILREAFNQKYYGMSTEEERQARRNNMTTMYGYSPNLKGWADQMKNNFQALSLGGLAWSDFIFDVGGTLGGPLGDAIDNRWDKATQLDNKTYQEIRKILSVVLPSIRTGRFTETALQNAGIRNMPWLQKALTRLGAWSLEGAVIGGLSDTSEDPYNLSRTMAELIPGAFGPEGTLPIPEAWKTTDAMSPAARKKLSMYENVGLAWVSVIAGSAIETLNGAKRMGWFKPKDAASEAYKARELAKVTDPEKLIEIQKIDELLATGGLSKQNENILINKKLQLEEGLDYVDDVDDAIKKSDDIADEEALNAAERKIDLADSIDDLDEIDPDISRGVLDPASEARRVPKEGNTARNIADTTAIKNGTSKGDPAPVITEAMRKKGLMVGPTSRGAVMGVAEETRDLGRFDAIVDGFRFSSKQMNAAAWDIYTSIVDAGASLDDVKALFLENRDVKNLLMGRFKVEVINEEQARAAAFAMRDLVDRFLGREVTEASARAMDTIGREASTLADTIKEMAPYVDDNRAMDLIIEKMEFLLDEYALNKYISGWSLRNKNWFDQVPPKELDTVIDQLTKEFTSVENSIHAKNMEFTKTLKELKKNNPSAMRPLVDAFAHTNGDVDSLAKLYKFAAEAITPWGMVKSPNPKQMNLFASGLWASNMNNALSGLSPLRAMGSALYMLTVKPITHGLGHGMWSLATGNYEAFQRAAFMSSSVWETNRRAIVNAWSMMKKAHKDPEMMVKAYRRDFQIKSSKEWDIAEGVRKVWEEQGDVGHALQYDLAKWLTALSKHPAMRYGMTSLVFPDAYTSTMMATYLSRLKAYDDVFSEFGFADWKKIGIAEKKHYDNLFDSDGLIKDDALRAIAGEIQLNLDDGLATWINEATTAYPISKYMFMFPRTGSNYIKASASWTPISAIPGMNKYSKTIYARTDDQIAAALKEHGIDITKEPNWKIIHEDLRAEYLGRQAFSMGMVTSLFGYAMAGNIRGNGHYNASRRNKERDQFGYEPKTIRFPIPGGGPENDIWVSYKGFPGIEQVLSIIGDMAYYANDLDQPMLEDLQAKIAWTLSASFLNETPLQGFQPLMEIMSGNLSGFQMQMARMARVTFIPLSSAAGVLAESIDAAQKDIEGYMHEYLMNRLPLLRSLLPNQVDIWTNTALNDVNSPWRKIANALNPYKVSATNEWWRQELFNLKWDGMRKLLKDSTGSYEYSTKERQAIHRLIAEQEPVKDLIKILRKSSYKKTIAEWRAHRSNNWFNKNKRIELDHTLLPIFAEIDGMLNIKQRIAEARLLERNPEIADSILQQRIANEQMKRGDVQGAIETKNNNVQQLLQMAK